MGSTMPGLNKNSSSDFDIYIQNAAPFARPILTRIRQLFHQACPEIQEVMKWNFPHFEHQGIVGSMAAFKQHVSYGFWKAKLMRDPHKLFAAVGKTSMGSMKVTHVDQLPADKILLAYIVEAVGLNESGKTVPRPKSKRGAIKDLPIPEDLQTALRKNKAARVTFENLSPSHRREYIEWITEAKQEATRQRRLATTLEWLSAGKSRNWKYERK
jgi:uncharacterized protein YdeI (YjbR/CyaY-like superfamily)